MSLKQMIHDEIVRPALRAITPTVLGRVLKSRDKHHADIELPDSKNSDTSYVTDAEGRATERWDHWHAYEKVPISGFSGLVSSRLQPGDAVWVEFLGSDRGQPRIIGHAGQWADPRTEQDKKAEKREKDIGNEKPTRVLFEFWKDDKLNAGQLLPTTAKYRTPITRP
jgi:hypothetical protein